MSPERRLYTAKRQVDRVFDTDQAKKEGAIKPVEINGKLIAMGIFQGYDSDSKSLEFNAAVLGEDNIDAVNIITNRLGEATPGGYAQLVSMSLEGKARNRNSYEIEVFDSVMRKLAQAGKENDPTQSLNPQNHLFKMMMSGVDFGHPYVELTVLKVVPTDYINFKISE